MLLGRYWNQKSGEWWIQEYALNGTLPSSGDFQPLALKIFVNSVKHSDLVAMCPVPVDIPPKSPLSVTSPSTYMGGAIVEGVDDGEDPDSDAVKFATNMDIAMSSQFLCLSTWTLISRGNPPSSSSFVYNAKYLECKKDAFVNTKLNWCLQ